MLRTALTTGLLALVIWMWKYVIDSGIDGLGAFISSFVSIICLIFITLIWGGANGLLSVFNNIGLFLTKIW